MMKTLRSHPYITLFIFTMLIYLAGNQLLAITDTAESNYALTAKEMVLSGDWISPQIYGRYWYDKPIFYYWELALSFALFGFNEMAARLPAAVLGSASVLFTYWFARRCYGEKAGWLSALILGTSVECWILSKAVITDSTLFLFMSASIAFFYLGYSENRKYYFLCYIFAALATLTKGPIGILLPGLACLLFLIYKKDIREMAHVHLFSGLLLFTLIAGAWYGTMCYLHGNDFLLNFIGVHNVLRATVSEHPSHNKWYFYIIIYFAGFAPWSFFVPVSLFHRWKRKELDLRSARDSTQLLLIYAFVVLIFFQLVATKYTTYTFPALFSLSILTAVLYKNYEFRIEKAALAAGAVYTVLAIAVAPSIMLNHSGKEIGEALAHLDTSGKTIAFLDDYRTSAVFYSGKTIYRAEPGDKIASMEPGTLSWNAKNVMPFIAEEDLMDNPDVLLITKDDNRSPFLIAYNEADASYRINVSGEYSLWLR
ncbi:ArnT family glycosyltransferase [Dialister sp.]|uniref:ArnT family glycosyltransferase n=1 Tax=Dialister sp. TaxID=1955814 RepID=UPI003F06B576